MGDATPFSAIETKDLKIDKFLEPFFFLMFWWQLHVDQWWQKKLFISGREQITVDITTTTLDIYKVNQHTNFAVLKILQRGIEWIYFVES